jgi:signal transduction histidine kinase
VADDGVGFDSSSAVPRGHLGLANMRDRARALGGALEVGSGGPGTTIIVTVPLGDATIDGTAAQEGTRDDA